MSLEQFANQAQSRLAASVAAADTILSVLSAAKFPAAPQFRIVVDGEIMLVTAVAGNQFTVARGQEGTAAIAHNAAAWVTHVLTVASLAAAIVASFPNVASLPLSHGQDGQRVWVQSLLCPWHYVANGASLTVDHITVEATADGGNTRWVRDDYAHPIWSSFGYVYIDGAAGNDENQGFYATPQATPARLKTHAELIRRVGHEWSPMQNTSVTYSSYPADALHLVLHFQAPVSVTFIGPALAANSLGTLSAVTARNNATNTPWDVVDGTVVTTGDVARRMRITSGPRAGSRAWVAKSTAAGHRRTSEWVTWSPASFVTPVAPLAGDPYVVESSPTQLKISHIVIEHSTGMAANFAGPSVVFNDIDFTPGVADGTVLIENGGAYLTFQDCLFTQGEWQVWTKARAGDFSAAYTFFANCCLGNAGINNIHFSQGQFTENFVWAGLGFGQLVARGGSGCSVDYNFLAQANGSVPNPAIAAYGQIAICTMGVMDWGANGGVIVGDGVVSMTNNYAGSGDTPSLWGSSANAGSVGVDVRAGGALRYQPGTLLTIVGVLGNFSVAGLSTARAWDDVAGAYTANITCTWANLVGGSLKDNAHNLMQNAHAYKNTAAAQP